MDVDLQMNIVGELTRDWTSSESSNVWLLVTVLSNIELWNSATRFILKIL